MDSNTYNNNPSEVTTQTLYPQDQSVQHQQHRPQYRCSHNNKIDRKSQPNSVVDYPYVLLPDQHIRDLTDVYRREKNFLEQSNKPVSHKIESNEEPEPKYYITENRYNVPCNCETPLPGSIFQKLINGMKISVEFFLFIGYVIGRRDELFEYYYPFDRQQTYNSQINRNYPFIRRSTCTTEMKKLNNIRNRLNRKPSSKKHTTTNTYYDIH